MEVAEEIGISQVQVSRLERKAIAMARELLA
jgi:DNA-directed RNA polymerase specialized sigma subunit